MATPAKATRAPKALEDRITEALVRAAYVHELPVTHKHVRVLADAVTHAATWTPASHRPNTLAGTRTLTERQRQVLAYAATGAGSDATAAGLGITACSVKSHLRHAYRNLGATNAAHAVAIAMRAGLLDDPTT